jgi:MOSC domain-containing protein YiiM
MGGVVLSVNVGELREVDWANDQRRTAIDKRPVAGPVEVYGECFGADKHGYAGHGGPDQAVYVYGREDADFWAAELGRELAPGVFGENLTTAGLPVSGAVTGERWRVGSTELEVTTPRIPCLTFTGFWGVQGLIKRFTAAGRPGAYLRVIRPGEIIAGDAIEVVSRPEHGVTVADLMAARAGDRTNADRILALDLPEKWKSWQRSLNRGAS